MTKKFSLTTRILLYMGIGLVIGSLINAFAPHVAWVQTYLVEGLFHIGGKMFIQLLQMLVVPLVLTSLICGVVGLNDIKTLGRIGGKAFGLFIFTTVLAITMALIFAIVTNIGADTELTLPHASDIVINEAPPLSDILIHLIPDNIIDAMAQGNMLQIIVICGFLGIAIANAGAAGQSIADGFAKFNDIMMVVINIVMDLAPYGVFCLIAKTFSEQGIHLIVPMIGYISVIIIALLFHSVVVFSVILLLNGLNPWIFLRKMRKVQVFAFSTASSNATIPITLYNAKKGLGVSDEIASFTIPLGATINMDGTAIMQGIATVFIAHIYHIDLALTDYLTIIGMSVMASIGTAGVPGVGLIMLAMVFNQVGLPLEGIALIIGVDRLIDMLRTAVNVTGDSMVSCIVAKSEKRLDQKIYDDLNAGTIEEWHEHARATGRS